MNLTAVAITAIICATVLAFIWICCKHGGEKK